MAAAELPRNLAGRQLGRYEVLTQLASGGMAGVYVARARGVAGFERLVAIKVLHPHLAYEEEFISMFLDEARLAARIRHPNVVPTLDISDTEGDGFFLVMEYIEGDHFGSLLGHAARGGERVPTACTIRVVLDALAGLGAAHRLTDEMGDALQLVHRDVSPHNVLVGADGIARLTDFGVAKAEKRLSSTKAGQFKGKLAYMAPEQASTGFADQRSDLFSMGIILWEALTGRRLFRGENNAATLTKILHEDIPLPSAFWPELTAFDEVLAIALDRDPEKRFQDAEAFAVALEDAAREYEGVATQRMVGEEVMHWLGERVEEQRQRVRAAIKQLGRSDYSEAAIPLPMEGSGSNITALGKRRPSSVDSMTVSSASMVAMTRGQIEEEQAATRKKQILATLVVLASLVIGTVLAFVFQGPEPEGDAQESGVVAAQPAAPPSDETPRETGEAAEEAAANADPAGDGTETPAEAISPVDPPGETDEGPVVVEEERPRTTSMRRRRRRAESAMQQATTAAVEAPPAMEEPATNPAPMVTPTMRRNPMNSGGMDLEFNPYR